MERPKSNIQNDFFSKNLFKGGSSIGTPPTLVFSVCLFIIFEERKKPALVLLKSWIFDITVPEIFFTSPNPNYSG